MDFRALLDWVTDASLVFSFLAAPLFYAWSVRRNRSITGIIFSWKSQGSALLTIVAFGINLSLFILMAVFFSGILGSRTYPEIFTFSADTMRRLALVSGSLLFGITLIYLGLTRSMTHLVTTQGIWLVGYHPYWFFPIRKLTQWHELKDYFYREDYPIREYNLIGTGNGNRRMQQKVKVPLTAAANFERILMHFLEMDISDDPEFMSIPDFRSR